MTKEERHRHAEAYINQIIAINRKYGMGDDTPEDVYKNAVDSAATAFTGLIRASR